jgi:hypothetical protein
LQLRDPGATRQATDRKQVDVVAGLRHQLLVASPPAGGERDVMAGIAQLVGHGDRRDQVSRSAAGGYEHAHARRVDRERIGWT